MFRNILLGIYRISLDMFKYFYLLGFIAVVGCTKNVAVPEIKESVQTITKQTVEFSDENTPVFFYSDNIGGHPSGRSDLANNWPYVLWMQIQTGTKQTCNTPMFKTAYPGEVTYFDNRLYESVDIGLCPNLPGRCFLITDKWHKGTVGENLDQTQACNPALADKIAKVFSDNRE